jgi:hypothetical protein
MIKIEKTEVFGWEAAMRGLRNPMNSWDKSDTDFSLSGIQSVGGILIPTIGENDHDLMMRLAKGGSTHAKYRRMINVTCDITAPLYWWKEFDTYKVGTVANSCSTMHKIHAKEFTLDDFSHEHLDDMDEFALADESGECEGWIVTTKSVLECIVSLLNYHREKFIETNDKHYWRQMIQLLPSSYNQKRTVQLNYEVLVGMYRDRRNHKLDEWVDFCKWIETLPYSEFITGG